MLDVAHSICNLNCSGHNKILIAFHNGSNYDYHSIIKVLTEEFEKQFTSLRKQWKILTFKIPIAIEVTRIDKNWEEVKK